MKKEAPQIIMLTLMTMEMSTHLFLNGRLRTPFNFFAYLFIDLPINLGLLWWGGFFG